MKVLITDGSNSITWYHGMEGKVFPVAYISNAHYFLPDQLDPDGDSYGPTGVHFPDGELLYTESEYNHINQELLQRREEVKQLMLERDDYLKKFQISESDQILAIKNADRLMDENIKFQRKNDAAQLEIKKCYGFINEKNKFIEQLKALKKSQPEKVVLPREVANALDTLKKCGYTVSGIMHYQQNHEEADDCHDELQVIRNYVCIDGHRRDGLSYADGVTIGMVNGYTIEEPQTFQTNRKLDASEIKSLRWWYEGAIARIKDGRDLDEYCKEAIEEVALYLGGASLLRDISPFCKNQLDKENKETK